MPTPWVLPPAWCSDGWLYELATKWWGFPACLHTTTASDHGFFQDEVEGENTKTVLKIVENIGPNPHTFCCI